MDCPVCSYPTKEIETIFFGMLYKCRNMSCFSKRFGNTGRTRQELEEIKQLFQRITQKREEI